jgi:hypothetical protein
VDPLRQHQATRHNVRFKHHHPSKETKRADLTTISPPFTGKAVDNSAVMRACGMAQQTASTPIVINVSRAPPALTALSIPNGPPQILTYANPPSCHQVMLRLGAAWCVTCFRGNSSSVADTHKRHDHEIRRDHQGNSPGNTRNDENMGISLTNCAFHQQRSRSNVMARLRAHVEISRRTLWKFHLRMCVSTAAGSPNDCVPAELGFMLDWNRNRVGLRSPIHVKTVPSALVTHFASTTSCSVQVRCSN